MPAASQTGRTPAPWSVADDDHFMGSDFIPVEGPDGIPVCEIHNYDRPLQDEQRANARLIAAAPDLLEALHRLTVFHSPSHPEHDALMEEYQEECVANEISCTSATMLDALVRAANKAIAKALSHD